MYLAVKSQRNVVMKLIIYVLRCQESLNWILWWYEGLGCPLLNAISIEFSCKTFSIISVASVGKDVRSTEKESSSAW